MTMINAYWIRKMMQLNRIYNLKMKTLQYPQSIHWLNMFIYEFQPPAIYSCSPGVVYGTGLYINLFINLYGGGSKLD